MILKSYLVTRAVARAFPLRSATYIVIILLATLGLFVAPASASAVKPSPASATYANPVIAQTTPDPSIIKALDGYYYLIYYLIATSDYWQNGSFHILPIYRSTDLVHWTFVGDSFSARPDWVQSTAGLVSYRQSTGTYLAVLIDPAKMELVTVPYRRGQVAGPEQSTPWPSTFDRSDWHHLSISEDMSNPAHPVLQVSLSDRNRDPLAQQGRALSETYAYGNGALASSPRTLVPTSTTSLQPYSAPM